MAVTVHEPVPTKVTTLPAIVQTPAEPVTPKVTGVGAAPAVALSVRFAAPNTTDKGGEKPVIAWFAAVTMMVELSCGAAK